MLLQQKLHMPEPILSTASFLDCLYLLQSDFQTLPFSPDKLQLEHWTHRYAAYHAAMLHKTYEQRLHGLLITLLRMPSK